VQGLGPCVERRVGSSPTARTFMCLAWSRRPCGPLARNARACFARPIPSFAIDDTTNQPHSSASAWRGFDSKRSGSLRSANPFFRDRRHDEPHALERLRLAGFGAKRSGSLRSANQFFCDRRHDEPTALERLRLAGLWPTPLWAAWRPAGLLRFRWRCRGWRGLLQTRWDLGIGGQMEVEPAVVPGSGA
jgi:hypothetical protein